MVEACLPTDLSHTREPVLRCGGSGVRECGGSEVLGFGGARTLRNCVDQRAEYPNVRFAAAASLYSLGVEGLPKDEDPKVQEMVELAITQITTKQPNRLRWTFEPPPTSKEAPG